MLLLLCSLAIPSSAEYVDVGGGFWLDMETGDYITDEEYNKRVAISEPEEPTPPSVPEMVVDGPVDSVTAVSSPLDDSDGMSDGEEQQPDSPVCPLWVLSEIIISVDYIPVGTGFGTLILTSRGVRRG